MSIPKLNDIQSREEATAARLELYNISEALGRLKGSPLATTSDPEQREINRAIDNCRASMENCRVMLKHYYGIEG